MCVPVVSCWPDFMAALHCPAGIQPHVMRQGWNFLKAEGDKGGERSARCKQLPDGFSWYGCNWRSSTRAEVIYNPNAGKKLTKAELAELHELAAKAKAEELARIKARHDAAAACACEIMRRSGPCTGSAYLERKGLAKAAVCLDSIPVEDARSAIATANIPQDDFRTQTLGELQGSLLVFPLTIDGTHPISVQFIGADGTKTFLKGARKAGSFWLLPQWREAIQKGRYQRVGMAEGVATALSVARLYRLPCVAGIDAGNLIPAAKSLSRLFPGIRIDFYADDDVNGKGLECAREAWRGLPVLSRGTIQTPAFLPGEIESFKAAHGKQPTDFNDLMVMREPK